MKKLLQNLPVAIVLIVSALVTAFLVRNWTESPEHEAVSEQTSKTVCKPAAKNAPELVAPTASKKTPESDSVSKPLFVYDTSALMRSFQPEMIFSENFQASYRDSMFSGSYQLAYPVGSPYDTFGNSKFNKLLLSMLFGDKAPKKVNRKSIQSALDGMMKGNLNTTRSWWNESKAKYGKHWRDEVCGCNGFFYAMPTEQASNWISFQQIGDYRCGGNGGPGEKYYTIVLGERFYARSESQIPDGYPYVMDTTAFVPDFREKMIDMITDNVIYNYYRYDYGREIGRENIREATAKQFAGDFQPVLTLSGVKFLFGTWALPNTSHADGRIPVIVPYQMIQEIFTEKFKKDIGLY